MFRWPEEIPREEYVRLYFLEKALRRFVVNMLSAISQKWWKQRVPGGVRNKAEQRKKEEEWRLGPTINLHPIWYIDFMDYAEILTRRDNWEEAFGCVFRSREDVRDTLGKLAPIRNKIAHMRPLTPRERKNLDALSEDILARIWDYMYTKPFVKPAKKLMQKGKYQEAENMLLEGFKKTEDPWMAYHLGILYEKMERLEEAKKQFEYAEKHLVLYRYKKLARKKLQRIKRKIRLGKVKICPKCGNEMPKEHLYCGKCGHAF
jgi:tetratricopeptide (TPR) repeat protein